MSVSWMFAAVILYFPGAKKIWKLENKSYLCTPI